MRIMETYILEMTQDLSNQGQVNKNEDDKADPLKVSN